ncbi:MAG TPA: isoprenylcysteine carboxylmethyltransferase family protein [Candidatus Limnocylindrales bacterium]
MGPHWLPDLGRRGEGWFLLQLVFFGAIAASGVAGPVWAGWPLAAGVALGGVLICCGGILSLRGVLDLRENLTPFPKPLDNAQLVETGAYRLVRHPIYGGLILGALGWGLVRAAPLTLLGTVALAVFFDLKSRREEIWLAERYEDYPAYRRRTRRLLPWIY